MVHPIRKHLSVSVSLSLDEAAALAAGGASAKATRRAIARGLRSLRWVDRLEAEAHAAGLALA